ncbi:hypothetical protein QTP86_017510, partial [Hemibagrus guttatus]
ERALDMFNFELLFGRPMHVMWSKLEPTVKIIRGGNIFIKNLDASINSIALFDTFSIFGKIVSCKVVDSKGYGYIQYKSVEAAALAVKHLNGKLLKGCQVMTENGCSKGFGFVSFTSSQDAMSAMNAMNGRKRDRKQVYVGLAQKREERQAHLQRMYNQQFNATQKLLQPVMPP